MKSIKHLIRENITLMEDQNKPELTLYKAINKYFKEFGQKRGMLVLDKIINDISKKHGPIQVSDKGFGPQPTSNTTIYEMMEEEDSVETIGDSLIQSEKFQEILNNTYSTDYTDEREYVDGIIMSLISDYIGTSMEEELFEYMETLYGEDLIYLYRSGEDDDQDGDNDLEYFV